MTKEQLDFEVAMLIEEKQQKGIGPVQADALELASKNTDTSYGEIVRRMRELAIERRYKPSVTVNKIPILLPL